MKKLIKYLSFLALVAIAFASCKKDENRITYLGGTAPVLTASSTNDLVLTKANASQHAISFSWTNPEYQFTTGVSSQDVTYYLQVDTAGANFSTPGNTSDIAISKELTVELNDSLLNRAIGAIDTAKGGLDVDVPHTIEFRIKSTLHGGNAVLYSNVVTVVVTPYLDVKVAVPFTDQLFLIGSATAGGWNNPVPATTQQFTKTSATTWEITVDLIGGQEYLIIPDNGSWDNKYAVNDNTLAGLNTGGDFGYNGANGFYNANFPGPAVSGTYKIELNFVTGKFKVTKL